MPLTAKGEEILSAMQKQYGSEKGKSVFYASKNAGTITGVDSEEDNCGTESAPGACFSEDNGNKLNLIMRGIQRLHHMMGRP